MLIIIHGSLIFYIILEYWRNKLISKKVSNNEINEGNYNRIIYLYNLPQKKNIKKLVVIILMIILDFIYDAGIMYYHKKYEDHSDLVFGEMYKFMDVFFLHFFFLLFHNITFYKHQYFSLFIILLMGLVRYFVMEFYVEESNKKLERNFFLLFIIFLIIFSFIDSINIYFFQKYMIFNYYSPLYICFLIGIIYLFISSIFIIIFNFIDCGNKENNDFCTFLSNKDIEKPEAWQIIVLILYSIAYSIQHFIKLLTINNYTVFHLILIVTIGEIVNCIFILCANFNLIDLIIDIIVYSFEIFGVLVFIEIIELNFCGLNHNLKKNIMFRAGKEVDSIYIIQEENESEETESDVNEQLGESQDTIY